MLFCLLFIFIFVMKAQNNRKEFIVIIDPGHGGKDAGAVGSFSKEKNINLDVALLIGGYINAGHSDVKVIYTRKTDKFVELNERSNIANRAKADLFISIHTNANKNKTPYGAETYTLGLARSDENLEVAKRENSVILLEDDYKQKYEGFDPNSSESYIIFEFMQNTHMEQSVSLASSIQKEFSRKSGRSDRGVRQAGFLVLRTTGMPSVLIELGFISNRNEEKYLNSKEGQKSLAKSIYNAFTQYKKEYDRKSGLVNTAVFLQEESDSLSGQLPEEKVFESKSSGIIYKVQILTSNKKLPKSSSQLKGYKADYYVEKGLYKYTYGTTSDWKEISKIRQSLLKDFKDAFIITFKNGKKIK